jgi:hypothetical protein
VGVCSTLSRGSPDAILLTHPATDAPGSRNVILLRKPSDGRIGRFRPFSYPEVGASRDGAPPGYPGQTNCGDDWARCRGRLRYSRDCP